MKLWGPYWPAGDGEAYQNQVFQLRSEYQIQSTVPETNPLGKKQSGEIAPAAREAGFKTNSQTSRMG